LSRHASAKTPAAWKKEKDAKQNTTSKHLIKRRQFQSVCQLINIFQSPTG
jgi:hypothetical protein